MVRNEWWSLRGAVVVVAVLAIAGTAFAQGHMAAGSDDELISSAMAAAPAAVSGHAQIVTVEADGSLRVVREGDNGWTCMPDSPATPGPDPMCMDANAMEWVKAWIAHQPPAAGKIGFMYMLQGGTDASNTDPYAAAPAADNHWIKTGPHVMILGAKDMMTGYPRTADPDTSKPYVMWPDTPYEHLMIPVK